MVSGPGEEKECANSVRQAGLGFKITYSKISVMKITSLLITLSAQKMKMLVKNRLIWVT